MESLAALGAETFTNLGALAESAGVAAVESTVEIDQAPIFDTEVFNSAL